MSMEEKFRAEIPNIVKYAQEYSSKKIRIIVAGGRDFDNYSKVENEVWRVIKRTKEKYHVPEKIGLDQFEIVSGHAAGADALGEKFAKKNNINALC